MHRTCGTNEALLHVGRGEKQECSSILTRSPYLLLDKRASSEHERSTTPQHQEEEGKNTSRGGVFILVCILITIGETRKKERIQVEK